MQNTMQIFEHKDFGELGVITIDGKPYFPATDCAKALGYKDTINAIKQHCRWVVKHHLPHPQNPQKNIAKNYIPEGDLYRLIIRSKLPAAEVFEKWIFDEVLPTIRKHGAFINEEILRRMQEDSVYAAELLRNLTAERKRSNALFGKVTELAPKALYHDIVLQCPDAVQVSIIAKDYGMSAVAFNRLLHRLNIQFRIGKTWLLYQCHEGNGYTVTNTYTRNGITTLIHTCWTQRGRYWLYKHLKSHGILPEVEKRDTAAQMTLNDMAAGI
jgi:prophage antirepressor-like protein